MRMNDGVIIEPNSRLAGEHIFGNHCRVGDASRIQKASFGEQCYIGEKCILGYIEAETAYIGKGTNIERGVFKEDVYLGRGVNVYERLEILGRGVMGGDCDIGSNLSSKSSIINNTDIHGSIIVNAVIRNGSIDNGSKIGIKCKLDGLVSIGGCVKIDPKTKLSCGYEFASESNILICDREVLAIVPATVLGIDANLIVYADRNIECVWVNGKAKTFKDWKFDYSIDFVEAFLWCVVDRYMNNQECLVKVLGYDKFGNKLLSQLEIRDIDDIII